MRKVLGLLMAATMALSATSALANCHGGSVRAYQEYMRFKNLVTPDVLAKSGDVVARLDVFFRDTYPQGQLKIDPSQLTVEQVAEQQKQVIADYKWVQAQLTTLRDTSRAAGASEESLQWLAYIDLPIIYTPDKSQSILRTELPKLVSFKDGSAYPKAKYDAVVQACANSLDKQGYTGVFDIASEGFFVKCGEIQPSDKRVDGHMQLTHSILDNVSALEAYERDHDGWWTKLTSL